MDNLEAQTYETFEKDTVKYIQVCSDSESHVCHGPADWPLLENCRIVILDRLEKL